jgi:hypothetical protein
MTPLVGLEPLISGDVSRTIHLLSVSGQMTGVFVFVDIATQKTIITPENMTDSESGDFIEREKLKKNPRTLKYDGITA